MHRASPQRAGRAVFVASLGGFAATVFVLGFGAAEPVRGDDELAARDGVAVGLNATARLFRPFLPSVGEPYPLDDVPRFVAPRGPLLCPSESIVAYRGARVRCDRNAYVHSAFLGRLERLEEIVVATALDIYGRPPRRLVHRGAYNCRRARGRPERMSEHALGNALDVQGFDFGPLARGATAPAALPTHLQRSFGVRVTRHWTPLRERDATHARFLHALADRLHHRPDVVRGIVAPPTRRHHDHLHLDAAPWRYAWYEHD